MRAKNLTAFAVAATISLVAAGHRWGDSAHAIGLIRVDGGEANHPIVLDGGRSLYSLIVTATVIPPYHGDTRLVLEGEPALDHTIQLSEAVIELPLRRRPELEDEVLHDLRPRDRLALWVVIRPEKPARGRYELNFYHAGTDSRVLSVPVIFRGEGEAGAERHR